ncbi:MAG: hypothetical protein KKD01_17715 [Proteobacteria bacterium]|nr:hypothetical protein [Pseudomonadota bacterium]MBU1139655.1 hypothetical protein [Pseudomonadota bacterium]MBU1234181.1 hypothetical protein [Pseudomonadota bacterium]MBU1419099.1 hypothetical protein [Pseudomonadota bacterium]MBU1456561.1 hypothetical protein [Pseudomonadota bacterium]
MDYREIVNSCYCGDASLKLEKAVRLAKEYGNEMLQFVDIKDQLGVVKAAVASLDIHMTGMEMGKTCTHCAVTPGGGCCSFYMGNENNDVLQLLMNILAGVVVKQVRNDSVECSFLGEQGCLLIFKPIFCLNYLCGRIRKESAVGALRDLEKKTATLLGAQSDLEQRLMRFLQQQPA